jgi:hypothetical protein
VAFLGACDFGFFKAATHGRQHRVYSVEKLHFGADAIFQFYRKAAENPRETRRTADWEGLRAEIVKSDCSLESRKFQAF